MRKLLLFILMGLSIPAVAQLGKSNDVGYIAKFAKLPKIKLAQSSATEYNLCKTANGPVKIKIQQSDTHFVLPAKNRKISLKKTNQEQNDFNGYEYLGYYPALKLYAITENSMSDNLGFGTLGLVDSLNASYYTIISIGDGAVGAPILAPDARYLIYYYNRLYDGDSCFIGLLQVNRKGKASQLLSEKISFDTDSFAVEGIRWLNGKTFIIKAYRTNRSDNKPGKIFSYYKAKTE